MRWLWRHSVLRFLAFLVTGLNLFSFGYQLILIARTQELHANAFDIGLMFAIGGAIGSLGTLAGSYLLHRLSFGRLMVIATWGWALTWVPYALAPNFATLFIGSLVGSPVVAIFILAQSTDQLRLVPDELRGRVNSVFRLMTVGVEPLSVAVTGGRSVTAPGPSTTEGTNNATLGLSLPPWLHPGASGTDTQCPWVWQPRTTARCAHPAPSPWQHDTVAQQLHT